MRAVSFFGDDVVIGAGMAAVAVRAGEGDSAGGFAGGRLGKWIGTVSRDSAGADEGELGGGDTVIRTVSFFGSFESAMRYDVQLRRCLTRRFLSLPKLLELEEIPRFRRDLCQ